MYLSSYKDEKERQEQRFVNITGKADLGEQKVNDAIILDAEKMVGKFFKLKVELKSLIP